MKDWKTNMLENAYFILNDFDIKQIDNDAILDILLCEKTIINNNKEHYFKQISNINFGEFDYDIYNKYHKIMIERENGVLKMNAIMALIMFIKGFASSILTDYELIKNRKDDMYESEIGCNYI